MALELEPATTALAEAAHVFGARAAVGALLMVRDYLVRPATPVEAREVAECFALDSASRQYLRARENNRAAFGGPAE